MVAEKYQDYMIKFIEDICNDIGPREAGTESELKCGDKIEEDMKEFCDKTHQEVFRCSPKAFLGFIRYGALMAIIAIIFYWLSLAIELQWISGDYMLELIFLTIGALLVTAAVIYFILEGI